MYTTETKQEIERVLAVFKPYIDHADFLEYVWSQKMQQYVFLFLDIPRGSIEESELVDTAAMICDRIYNEIGNDVMLAADMECPIWQAPEAEKAEFLRRIQPYDDQLPAYHNIAMQILDPHKCK